MDGNASGEITRCDPPTAFDLTWEYAENVSWVTVRLEPVADGTRLTLEHIMAKDEASEAHWKKFGPGATGVGWDLSFMGLGLHLVRGDSIDQKKNNAWMASVEGKSFIRNCARAWGDAHVECGEDAEVALAMADETANFYCGE